MRPDRDRFVRIHCENILSNMTTDFRRLKPDVVSQFGDAYDFYSIMHYRLDHFSKNGKPTIEPIDTEGLRIDDVGRMERLTDRDVMKLNKLYKC